MMYKYNVEDIRKELSRLYMNKQFVVDKNGGKCIEIVSASFIADEPTIFGKLNEYIDRELEWYKSMSLNVYDIPKPVPQIWINVASPLGYINSNYGWCIWSKDNNSQYNACLSQLINDKDSRRATMIYMRPNMQTDYNKHGMSDFMCTFSTQLLIRDNTLHYIVNMRSGDSIFGYKNDKAWHDYVHQLSLDDLKVHYPDLTLGDMHWSAGSLHVYSRHFNLIEEHVKLRK